MRFFLYTCLLSGGFILGVIMLERYGYHERVKGYELARQELGTESEQWKAYSMELSRRLSAQQKSITATLKGMNMKKIIGKLEGKFWRCIKCKRDFIDREHLEGHLVEFHRYAVFQVNLIDSVITINEVVAN